jgi:hypothetical protein
MSLRRSSFVGPNDSSAILIDFYDGTYGPTVRVDIQSASSLLALIHELQSILQQKEGGGISRRESLSRTKFAPPMADMRLVMGTKETVELRRAEDGLIIVEWTEPIEGWEDAIELCRSLTDVKAGNGRHQYLTRSEGCTIVELAMME